MKGKKHEISQSERTVAHTKPLSTQMSRSTDQALSGWGVHLLPSYNALHSQYTLKTFRFEDEISRFFREGKGSQKRISCSDLLHYYFLLLLFLVGG